MKKVSRILLTVGGILHIINAVSLFLAACYMFVASIAFIAFGFNWFGIEYSEEMLEAFPMAFTLCAVIYIVLGFSFICMGILCIIASKFAFGAIDSGDRKKYIVTIVLSAIIECVPAIVGAVFGLFTIKDKDEAPQVTEEASEVVK